MCNNIWKTGLGALGIAAMLLLIGCSEKPSANQTKKKNVKECLASIDSIEILREIVDFAKDDFDIAEVALWLRNKKTGEETKILQTVRPDWHCWYMSDGTEFCPVPFDSLLVASRVHIHNLEPLQLIVEGCPDCRNEFSYFVDVTARKAWYVPANSGYLGSTEEGYMIFRSYRYVSDPEIAGRYTFLQVFDENGCMVDSLDLEHVRLSAFRNEEINN